MLVVDIFSRHTDPYAMNNGEINGLSLAEKLANDYVPCWGCPRTTRSDRGPEFTGEMSKAMYEMLGAAKRVTTSYHPQMNGTIERLNHNICQMLSHLVADHQADWDQKLMHAVAARNNNISRETGLAPNEAHISRYPRLPMAISEGRGVAGQQGLRRDQLDHLTLMRDRQEKAWNLVGRENQLIKARHQTNKGLDKILHRQAEQEAGDRAWVYGSKFATMRGVEAVTRPAEVGGEAMNKRAFVSETSVTFDGPV